MPSPPGRRGRCHAWPPAQGWTGRAAWSQLWRWDAGAGQRAGGEAGDLAAALASGRRNRAAMATPTAATVATAA
jgi:hypothetical protein